MYLNYGDVSVGDVFQNRYGKLWVVLSVRVNSLGNCHIRWSFLDELEQDAHEGNGPENATLDSHLLCRA